MASGVGGAGTGAFVRGIRAEDLTEMDTVSGNIQTGDLVSFAAGDGVADEKARGMTPMMVTNSNASGDNSNTGDMRATKKTPAVTMVAA